MLLGYRTSSRLKPARPWLLACILIVGACQATWASTFVFTPYSNGTAAYLQFLDHAQHTVLIAIYGFTDPAITDKLIELKNRGVEVSMVLDQSQAGGKKESEEIARLQGAGIDLVIGRSAMHGIMHCKFSVIDDELVQTGSWNYTTSATLQDNVLEFIDDRAVASSFTSFWQRIRTDMERIPQRRRAASR